VKLLKDMRPVREEKDATEYLDGADDVPARSARIYVFCRTGITASANIDRAA
jgi:hypothetical protein